MDNFDEETFVAFLDISGFKAYMNDENKAWDALDKFYQYGFDALENKEQVDGLFISDCGIIFVRNGQNALERLKSLLEVSKEINERMLEHNWMLTTSIAYGRFKYQERREHNGIRKNAIYGIGYVASFSDNEKGKPKREPGQCRIVKEKLPRVIMDELDNPTQNDEILKFVKRRNSDRNHYYFYWMVENPLKIDDFENRYINSKYRGMIDALKGERD